MGIEKIGAYYDKMSNQGYDEIYGSAVCKAEDRVLISSVVSGLKGSKFLDIGCGTGLVASYLDRKQPGYIGIDVSRNELKVANEKLSGFQGQFAQADMQKLPFPNSSFDSIISAYGPYSYSLEPKILLNEFLRVLKPEGFFAIMPYTKRTGMSIGLGGFSTAVEPSIKKIFYTEKSAKDVFDNVKDLKIEGINFLVNLIIEKRETGAINHPITEDFLTKELVSLGKTVDSGITLTENFDFANMVKLWNHFLENTDNEDLAAQIMMEEIRILGQKIPAHWARHMLVFGRK